ncbi:PIN domain-containing protein [Cronobacter turicensis]
MAFSGTILSNVYDITSFNPSDKDSFIVDTNVWYWLTYSKGVPSHRPYLHNYTSFINTALSNDSKLFHSGLSLSELAHIIEGTERRIHEKVINKKIETKEFRQTYVKERTNATKEIEASWLQVENIANQIEINICDRVTTNCVTKMATTTLDGYDLMIHESMINSGIFNIITDDADFTSVAGINVFTSNKNVIQAASAQKKLIV